MDLPHWVNRESVQLALIFIVTIGFHFYFISSRISFGESENEPKIEQKSQSEWNFKTTNSLYVNYRLLYEVKNCSNLNING